ncbi:MAG: hypothetical protein RI957_430 [Verrucomicrobiota bacterium]|jgi:hypothetical protein
MITRNNKRMGFLSLLIIGMVFTCAGSAMAWFLGRDTTLHCQRDVNHCRIEQVNLFGQTKTIKEFPLSILKSAEVENRRKSSSRKNRSSTTYQVQLHTHDGIIPLNQVWTSNSADHQQRARQINKFLSSRENILHITQPGKTIRCIGYGIGAIGLLMLLGALWRILRTCLVRGLLHAG